MNAICAKTARLLLPLLIAGCSHPLPKVTYDQPVISRTDKVATVELVTRQSSGRAPLVPGAGAQFELTNVQFNIEDQGIFAQCLKDELNRLGLVRVMPAGSPEVTIVLTFTKSEFKMPYEHTLGLTMNLSSGDKTFTRAYQVNTYDGETEGAKWTTNGKEGKKLAAAKLLAKLIPDIDTFLAGD